MQIVGVKKHNNKKHEEQQARRPALKTKKKKKKQTERYETQRDLSQKEIRLYKQDAVFSLKIFAVTKKKKQQDQQPRRDVS